MQTLFESIDTYLVNHQSFWRFEPFFTSQQKKLPWASTHPLLCQWLENLTEEQIEHYKQDFESLASVVDQYFPQLRDFLAQLQLDRVALNGLNLERGIDAGVPGRKLEQIVAMGEASLLQHSGNEWLEWCAGKGFLGRVLASQSQQKVTSFEYQQALCEAGQVEADKQGLSMHFIQGDAFNVDASKVFNPQQHAVALHACGDLHITLIEKAVEHQLPAITLSPCCYHLIHSAQYQPLSQPAMRSSLRLTQAELRIPLQELVTGGERVKRHRLQEMSYRLGLDILLRQELGQQQYLPIPSVKKSQLSDGFEAFCLWAAEKKEMALPGCDFSYYQQLGEQRFWQMERLSLVQQLFKRGLELWLVLDKALYLQQHGYQVSVAEFCSREMTPRNLLLQARKI